ncbi:fumarate hydratase, partial [Huaxiibacter chinensis]|uniref:fumarate hydratase n=1 Tax=Huaxiibacter chinensis TaxID=2899785 RepID=UPI003D322E34
MSNKPFHYQNPFPLAHDDTEYYLLSKEHVSVTMFEGQEILKVAPQALTLLAQQAFHDAAFMLRPSHQKHVAAILNDPQASENDKYVALQFLRNSEIAAKGVLPTCQDTGTAIIMGKKGQRVWTGGGDEAALSQGVYNTYVEDNLRYSQNAALDMYKEVNTGTNLPAQIDLYSVDGDEYKFLCVAKGGGSANKTYLYQETKALITPAKLKNYLVEKMRSLGTAACPPYHIAFVIGGTSAESTLKTVKLASTRYYDGLPTEGNEHGQAFRDVQLEQELLQEAQNLGLGAQFGGKYFAHDIRVIRLPRHGASCPVG